MIYLEIYPAEDEKKPKDISLESYNKSENATSKEVILMAAVLELGLDEAVGQVFHNLPSAMVRNELSAFSADAPVSSDALMTKVMFSNTWIDLMANATNCF